MCFFIAQSSSQTINIGGFGDEALAAFIVFLLGIIFTILYQKLTEKKRRLTCTHTIYQPKLDLGKQIANRVKISLDNRAVDSLAVHHLTIRNSGDFAIRDQEVLFEFALNDADLLDNSIDCENLVGPVVQLKSIQTNQFRYKIILLPKDKYVDFHFYTTSSKDVGSSLKIEWRNETDTEVSVSLHKGGQTPVNKTDIQRILVLYLAYMIFPEFLNRFGYFGAMAALACRLVLVIVAYPAIRRLLNYWSWNPPKNSAFNIGSIDSGDNTSIVIRSDQTS